MKKKALFTFFLAPLLLFSSTTLASAAENTSAERPINHISISKNVSIQAADRVWIDDLLYISQYDGGATKYFEKTVDGTRYRGYLSKYKQAGFYQYYQGYLYREGIPYPIPSVVKPISL